MSGSSDTAPAQWVYALADDVQVTSAGDAIVVSSARDSIKLSGLSAAGREVMIRLADHPCTEDEIDTAISDGGGLDALTRFYYYVPSLLHRRMLTLSVRGANGHPPFAVLEPISKYYRHRRAPVSLASRYRLSRFAYVRRGEGGGIHLESPLSHARVYLVHEAAVQAIYALGKGATVANLATSSGMALDLSRALMTLLLSGGFIDPLDERDAMPEDRDATLMQWEFHDLLFHTRSRLGRHDYPAGGRFRFLNRLPPQPPVKVPETVLATIALPKPDLAEVRSRDPGLEAVMDARVSVRRLVSWPITLAELGEFLFRTARVKRQYVVDDKGAFTSRPYPSGGASYELELYLTIDQCAGVAPGLYWYDPINHALGLLKGMDNDLRATLLDAHTATAGLAWPQVLITIAARFQRVSWKYEAMAYATVLKNTGVLYATMYLVATAMGLGPCGVGLGDSDRFARLAGTNYFEETSVGEFILSSGRGH